MVKFYREGSKVKIHIQHGIFRNDVGFELEIVQSQDYQAQLLTEAFQKNLNRNLERIKEEYYNKGWKDAKSKKVGKRKDFWGGWEL